MVASISLCEMEMFYLHPFQKSQSIFYQIIFLIV